MAYDLNRLLFVENGPAIHSANAQAARVSSRYRRWQSLDADGRFDLVERALGTPANDDLSDGYPVAL